MFHLVKLDKVIYIYIYIYAEHEIDTLQVVMHSKFKFERKNLWITIWESLACSGFCLQYDTRKWDVHFRAIFYRSRIFSKVGNNFQVK